MRFLVVWFLATALFGGALAMFFGAESGDAVVLLGCVPGAFTAAWLVKKDNEGKARERGRLRVVEEEELARIRHERRA